MTLPSTIGVGGGMASLPVFVQSQSHSDGGRVAIRIYTPLSRLDMAYAVDIALKLLGILSVYLSTYVSIYQLLPLGTSNPPVYLVIDSRSNQQITGFVIIIVSKPASND